MSKQDRMRAASVAMVGLGLLLAWSLSWLRAPWGLTWYFVFASGAHYQRYRDLAERLRV